MKLSHKIILAALSAAVLAGGVYFYFSHEATAPTTEATTTTIERPELDFSFQYPTGSQGLVLVEPPTTENTAMRGAFILMPEIDYAAYQAGDTTESPASMSIFVFAEADSDQVEENVADTERPGRITRLQTWAAENENLTSFSRAKATPEVVDLDGLSALKYEADGLYQQQIYLAGYKGNIYMFVGQYNDPADAIYEQFKTLMTTVSFN